MSKIALNRILDKLPASTADANHLLKLLYGKYLILKKIISNKQINLQFRKIEYIMTSQVILWIQDLVITV